jgi:hypothetical protein
MNIKLFKPESNLLKEHIEFFYTLTGIDDEEDEAYLVFPTKRSIKTNWLMQTGKPLLTLIFDENGQESKSEFE